MTEPKCRQLEPSEPLSVTIVSDPQALEDAIYVDGLYHCDHPSVDVGDLIDEFKGRPIVLSAFQCEPFNGVWPANLSDLKSRSETVESTAVTDSGDGWEIVTDPEYVLTTEDQCGKWSQVSALAGCKAGVKWEYGWEFRRRKPQPVGGAVAATGSTAMLIEMQSLKDQVETLKAEVAA